MDTPVLKTPYYRLRVVLLIVIITAAVVALGWFIYKRYIWKPLTREQFQAQVLKDIAADSPAQPASVTQPVLDSLTASNAAAKKDKKGMESVQYSAEQKTSIMNSLNLAK